MPESTPLPTAREILAAYACGKDRCSCVRALTAGKGVTHCPAHEDGDPSFSVSDGDDGKPLFHCFAGCAATETIAAMQRDRVWPESGSTNSYQNGAGPTCVVSLPRTRWAYMWEAGEVVAYHKRVEKADGKKSFVWELPDGRTSAGTVAIADLPLYRRVEVLSAPADAVILVCEGERAADAAAEHGFVSTSFGGGASQRDFGRALEDLRGRHVALWPDNDNAGELLMERLAEGLHGVAATVRVIDVTDLPAKGDAFDYFSAGRSAAEVAALVASPGVRARVRRFEIIEAPDFLDRPPLTWLVDEFLPAQSFAVIVGGPGSLKSFIALDLAAAISLGESFQGFKTRQGAVLYVVGEGGGGFSIRMKAWQKHRKMQLPRALKLLPFPVPLVDHASVRDLIEDVESFGEKFELVVIDTLSRSLAGEDENASVPMTKAVEAAGLIQRALGCCVLLIHHGRKSDGELRGHGSLRGALDTIIVTDRDKARGEVRVDCWKQKDSAEFVPFILYPIVVDVTPPVTLRDVPTTRVTSLVLERLAYETEQERKGDRMVSRLNADERLTLRALASFGATGAVSREWMDASRTLAGETIARQTFHRRVAKFVDAGLVIIPTARAGEGVHVVTQEARDALGRLEQESVTRVTQASRGDAGDA
ncbi:MAG TPA: AAA family ATPase [Chloroflexota bacterium]|nr:AAA family ATPase [Chloroflexota bacterium]